MCQLESGGWDRESVPYSRKVGVCVRGGKELDSNGKALPWRRLFSP